jgi:hypothetical protein
VRDVHETQLPQSLGPGVDGFSLFPRTTPRTVLVRSEKENGDREWTCTGQFPS